LCNRLLHKYRGVMKASAPIPHDLPL
jgi:hypothetical protein